MTSLDIGIEYIYVMYDELIAQPLLIATSLNDASQVNAVQNIACCND